MLGRKDPISTRVDGKYPLGCQEFHFCSEIFPSFPPAYVSLPQVSSLKGFKPTHTHAPSQPGIQVGAQQNSYGMKKKHGRGQKKEINDPNLSTQSRVQPTSEEQHSLKKEMMRCSLAILQNAKGQMHLSRVKYHSFFPFESTSKFNF